MTAIHEQLPLIRQKARLLGPFMGQLGPFVGVSTVLAALLLTMAFTEPGYYNAANLGNITRTLAVPLLLAGGQTFALLIGNVDLSVGSLVALNALVYTKLYYAGVPAELAVLLCIGCAGAIGFFVNGMLIGRLSMSFFVVTLGGLSLYRGIVFLWDQSTIDMYNDRTSELFGDRAVLGQRIGVGFLLVVGVILILYGVLRYTTFGRQVYAVGGNREAADLAGVPSSWVIAGVYGVIGLCVGLAAVMTVGRSASFDPSTGQGLELQSAAAVLLGGVALSGGVGSIWGVVLAATLLTCLSNALSFIGAQASWQLVLTGGILILAVYLDSLRTRRRAR
jgi:ribose transport system permease protein